MANTVIQLKKSSTPTAIPASLEFGELAINYADGKLYYKNTNSQIAEISGAGGPGGDSFGTVNANGVLIIADTAGDVLTLEAGQNITIIGDAINDKITISATSNITPAFDAANNALTTGQAAFDKANAANVLAFNTGIGANAYSRVFANSVGDSANAYSRVFANTKLANTTGTFAGSLTISNDLITQGDVGIGTTLPTSNLHVIGTANITSALTVSTIELGHVSDTTLARSSAGNVTIEGNIIYRAGGTDVPVTDGGTGASDAATARTNLGLAIGTNVQAYNAGLAAIASLAVTDSNIIVGNGTTWVAETGATARTSLGLGTANDVQFDSIGVGTAASGITGEIRATNNITAYYSDGRLKTIISTIPNPVEKIKHLSGVLFINNETAEKYGYGSKKEQVGVIAQEVEKVLPQIVVPAPFDIGKNDDGTEYSISGEHYKTVQYEKLVPLLIEAIKEQQQQIDELKDLLIKSGINKV